MIRLPGSLSSIRGRETLARAQALKRTWPVVMDLCVAGIGLACFYGVVRIAHYWFGHAEPEIVISLSPRALPLYAFYSIVRIGLAYILSLLFAVGYGYVAAYSRRLEPLMVAGLDICQSIPVLSFLPGVMLAMVALFPTRQIGVEMGAILLIFTGEVWNMAFSFYSSIKSIPRELSEAATIYRFSRWQRLWQLELPYGAIGLVWNSMVSVAGGWFFLMACEMFVLGTRDFRLPGLGSYLQTAASENDTRAIVMGLAVMIGIIVAIDQLIWRPAIVWSDKFKFEQVEGGAHVRSPLLHLLTHSGALRTLRRHTLDPVSENIYCSLAQRRERRLSLADGVTEKKGSAWFRWVAVLLLLVAVIYLASEALILLRQVRAPQLVAVLHGAAATFLRVNIALVIAAAWTIPVGVAIGFNPKLARLAQPLAQIAASVPATALFPVILLALIRVGGGMGIASILLMLIGTQWYILFNVIAGAMAIPSDLREVAQLFHFSTLQRWRTVILPGIFPFLITGMVTASGGAWNASIIAEYFHLNNQTMQTVGLGAQISSATDHGEFHLLLLSTIVMALMVVTINRLVWRPLYRLSETRYKLDA
ncbi:ABC transporter permease [Granulicella mallensis]|uniref:Binding-protein-dependent transport systems inner membrane component n=1 Tax=Granulicella mallensis (strain ATCC BAA-1857 / DSM 23137 / MP5ACTX8) TaxID=682795 RepID=G8P105_GRAMM|nr:ABC transporter permease subunit [Granulicella mallensis]AEU36929.1 binding-protein-dependent transport systems inner membrane component [Granulicella mallensis MP5ACTX8]